MSDHWAEPPRIHWNLDITKCQGTGKICWLQRVFVISRYYSIYFSITRGKNRSLYRGLRYIKVRYIEVPLYFLVSPGVHRLVKSTETRKTLFGILVSSKTLVSRM